MTVKYDLESSKQQFLSGTLDYLDALIPDNSSKELLNVRDKIKKSVKDNGNSFYRNMLLIISVYFAGKDFYSIMSNKTGVNNA